MNPDSNLIDLAGQFPPGLLLTGVVVLLLCLTAWFKTVVLARKNQHSSLLAVIPLTTPLAAIYLIRKKIPGRFLAPGCVLAAVATWFSGGHLSNTLEKNRLEQAKQSLAPSMELLQPISGRNSSELTEHHVWNHPFFSPAVPPPTFNSDGMDKWQLECIDENYRSLMLPENRYSVIYEGIDPKIIRTYTPVLHNLHALAVNHMLEDNPFRNKEDLPQTASDVLEHVSKLFKKMQPDWDDLHDAVSLPKTDYPFQDHPSNKWISYVHTTLLSQLIKTASTRSVFHSMLRDAQASFADATLAFKLRELPSSNEPRFIIDQSSMLYQALGALAGAQSYHIWTEDQWKEMQSIIETIKPPEIMEHCYRGHTLKSYEKYSRMPNLSWSEAWDAWAIVFNLNSHNRPYFSPNSDNPLILLIYDAMDTLLPAPDNTHLNWIADIILTEPFQAFLNRQLRLCLPAYHHTLEQLDALAENSSLEPYNQPTDVTKGLNRKQAIKKFGLLHEPAIPRFESLWSMVKHMEIRLQLAKVSIALERYRLRNGQYPNRLDSLVPDYFPSNPVDLASGTPLKYKTTGTDGFQLYSVGFNGDDENGIRIKNQWPPDDIIWFNHGSNSVIPAFTISDDY